MGQKVPVSGVVEQVKQDGTAFKLGGKWYTRADRVAQDFTAPEVGAAINFDAYGGKQDIVYRYMTGGESKTNGNGQSGSNGVHRPERVHAGSPAPVAGGGSNAGVGSTRAAALLAAATLLQGSEGTVEVVAGNAIAVARAFEAYLGAKGDCPPADADDRLYWVVDPDQFLGMENQ